MMVEESEFISFFVREQKYKIKWLEILEKKVGDILYFSEIKKNIAKLKIKAKDKANMIFGDLYAKGNLK